MPILSCVQSYKHHCQHFISGHTFYCVHWFQTGWCCHIILLFYFLLLLHNYVLSVCALSYFGLCQLSNETLNLCVDNSCTFIYWKVHIRCYVLNMRERSCGDFFKKTHRSEFYYYCYYYYCIIVVVILFIYYYIYIYYFLILIFILLLAAQYI